MLKLKQAESLVPDTSPSKIAARAMSYLLPWLWVHKSDTDTEARGVPKRVGALPGHTLRVKSASKIIQPGQELAGGKAAQTS